MIETELGWVVIERNQASHWPEVLDGCGILTVEQEAAELAALEEAANRARHRQERYSIAKIVEVTYDD